MDADAALEIVERILNNRRLSKLQAIVLRQTWDELSYQEIAKTAGYEVGYIKQTGSQLWQSLSKALGERVSKNNLQSVLRQYANREGRRGDAGMGRGDGGTRGQGDVENSYPTPYSLLPTPFQDWGEAADVSIFYGRSTELAMLEQWILEDECRLVGLFGMGGIGKTALSVRLAKQIQATFEYVIWRSLRNAPPIRDLLNDLIQFVDRQQSQVLAEADTLDKQILRLLHYLRAHRCLLLLDNAETVMQPGDRNGGYQPGYEGYGQLLRCVGETPHQSCLLVTSREKPKGLAPREGDRLPVRSLQVAGLTPTTGRELFGVKGEFSGSPEEWQTVIDHYAGNPLALKIVATAIADFFDGSLTQFLAFSQQGSSVFGDIRDLLARQIGRLSPLEQQVMFWLAINREPVRFAELQSDCLPPVSPAQLLETVTALERRSLIEKSGNFFTLQPVVMEYMTERLIDEVCAEIEGIRWQEAEGAGRTREAGGAGEAGETREAAFMQHTLHPTPHPVRLSAHVEALHPTPLLRSHALIKAQAKDYVRETQLRLILQPVVDRLRHTSSQAELDDRLMQLVAALQGKPAQTIGYAGGNVINLLCQLQAGSGEDTLAPGATVTLRDRDFSHLAIWQAYLQKVNLYGTNFSYTDLSKSVFTETFSQILCVAFSPDGKLLAASDISYEVHVWRVADGKKLLTCKARDGWAWSVTFSPDNRLFASSANGTIHLWDVQTGDCMQTLQGSTSRVFSLAFSPDGVYLASGNEDQHVRIWHVATGTLTAVLSEHTDEVHAVAFSPDGCLLASGSYDRTIKLWDVSTWEKRETEGRREERGERREERGERREERGEIFFTPYPLPLTPHPSPLTSYPSPLTPHPLPLTLTGHSHWVWSVAFSEDGKTLASSSSDRTIRLWDMQTHQCRQTLVGHSQAVRSIAFASAADSRANGAYLISGSDDRTVRLWNREGDCLRVLQGHTSWISAVAVSPDGCLLASGSEDQSVRLWDSRTSQCLRLLQGYNSGIWSIAFSPDGQTLVSGGQDRMVRLWQLESGRQKGEGRREERGERREEKFSSPHTPHSSPLTLHGHTSWIWSVAFSPDGQTVASGSEDGTVRLWAIAALDHVHSPEMIETSAREITKPSARKTVPHPTPHTPHLTPVIPHPSSLIPLSSPPSIQVLHGHTHAVWSVAFSADGQLIASGSLDGTVRLWHREAGTVQALLRGHDSGVCAVAFSPRSPTGDRAAPLPLVQKRSSAERLDLRHDHSYQLLVSGSQDQTIRLWAIETEPTPHSTMPSPVTVRCLKTLHGHTSWIRCVAVNPTGTTLASGSSDGIVILWDLATGDRKYTFHAHDSLVLTVAFSPDGTVLASSGGDGVIKLWDLSENRASEEATPSAPSPPPLHGTLYGHHNWVRFLTYSADGKLLASCSQDGTIKLWDWSGQRQADVPTCLHTLRVERPYEGAIITGVTGLTTAQKNTLTLLGAIE